MTEELKQAAHQALEVLKSATSFMSKKARDQHDKTVARLERALTAAQPAQAEREAFEAWWREHHGAREYFGRFEAAASPFVGEYRDASVQGGWNVWRAARASLPTQPAQAAQVPDIDYQALIQAAWGTHKYAQGTRGCIAFKHGAEWFRGLLTAAQQGATND